jgi:hypothetical protein
MNPGTQWSQSINDGFMQDTINRADTVITSGSYLDFEGTSEIEFEQSLDGGYTPAGSGWLLRPPGVP